MGTHDESHEALLGAITEALSRFKPAELQLFTVAVLHGVPVTRLGEPVQRNTDLLITSLKRLRKELTEAGVGAAEVEKAYKKRK